MEWCSSAASRPPGSGRKALSSSKGLRPGGMKENVLADGATEVPRSFPSVRFVREQSRDSTSERRSRSAPSDRARIARSSCCRRSACAIRAAVIGWVGSWVLIGGWADGLRTVAAAEAVAAALGASPKPPPIEAPTRKQIDEAIARGVDFLLQRQNPDGSWGLPDMRRPYQVTAPIPGAHHAFRAGTSGLCISALIEAGGDRPDVQKSLDRAEQWACQTLPRLRRATPDVFYNSWGHIYSIAALVQLRTRCGDDAARRQRIDETLKQQMELLERYEVVDGGWAYYDFEIGTKKPAGSSISFVSAAALVSLDAAKQAGFQMDRKTIDRAIESINRQRKSDFSYCYGEYLKYNPMHPVNRPAGSLGRSQCCNLALRLWGDASVTDEVLKSWLDRLYARNGWLDIGRKRPIPHESHFAIAGYFFYFGHYYGARCIELLPQEQRAPYQVQLARILIDLQEKDGSWWDFPMYDYHQQYGTAFALMSLARCR